MKRHAKTSATNEWAFDLKRADWTLQWPGRVARHDLCYLTPPWDPMHGLALGNGDVGVLAWCKDSRVIMAINKCDLWDDAPFDRFHNWRAEEEENSTTLRHAGRIIVDFQLPVFHLFYLRDFQARLCLADASLSIRAAGPFGRVSLRAFVDHRDGLICGEVDSDLRESVPLTITLERFGSRTFSHWYSLIQPDAALGLSGTDSAAARDSVYITHRLRTGRFGLGCRLVAGKNTRVQSERIHSRAAKLTVQSRPRMRLALFAAVTAPMSGDPRPELERRLAPLRRAALRTRRRRHRAAWKSFWLRSFMEFGDPYLDNLWHLAMYYANASQRGSYPGRFINGLWGWNRDVQNWNFYFHWNQQQIYWPLNAAGHHDLLQSYLEYRFNSLPAATRDARELCRAEGAMVSDVTERRGFNSLSEFANHTPVAQIAMDFWRQYTYTGDEDFLRRRALPCLLAAARYFESCFTRERDGRYHARAGTGYEGWISLRDCISELVYARVLFTTTLHALKLTATTDPRERKWREILDRLAPLPLIPAGKKCIARNRRGWRYERGLFKGELAGSGNILAAGFGLKEKRWLTSMIPAPPAPRTNADLGEIIHQLEANQTPYSALREDLKCHDGIFPKVEASAVFPSGLVGLAQRDSELFTVSANTAKLHAPDCMGWDPLPIVLARLGLGRELGRVIASWPARWQFFRNGFGHYGPRDIMLADRALKARTTRVRDASRPEAEREPNAFPFPAWPFRHMGMESMSVLAGAMNEALLQGHEGLIRVGPATVDRQAARFTLHAPDGFVVSAQIARGKPEWIVIRSLCGLVGRVVNPWPCAWIWRGQQPRAEIHRARTIELPTRAGEIILLAPHAADRSRWRTVREAAAPNTGPKSAAVGTASLGLPRMF